LWAEPLTADTRRRDRYTFDALVRQADGRAVAGVRCTVNPDTRTGWFGAMVITDPDGAPRQKVRALVLLVRESLREAADQGIRRVRTEAPDRMLAFARRMSGLDGLRLTDDHNLIAGELHRIRTHALETSNADGDLAD